MERLLAYAPMAHTARGNLVQRRSMERLCSPMRRWRIRLVYWRAYAPMAHTACFVCLRMPCRRLEAWRGRDARLPAAVLIHQVKARLLAVARRFKDEIAPIGRP